MCATCYDSLRRATTMPRLRRIERCQSATHQRTPFQDKSHIDDRESQPQWWSQLLKLDATSDNKPPHALRGIDTMCQ